MLPEKAERIALQYQLTKAISHFELIVGSFHDAGDKYLPNSCFHALAHRMRAPVPSVEIANNTDSLGVWSPHREDATSMTVDLSQVSAEFLVNLVVVPLLKQMHVQFAKNLTERIRIAKLDLLPGPRRDLEQVIERLLYSRQLRFEETFVGNLGRRKMALRVISI